MAKKTGEKYINFQASDEEFTKLRAFCQAQNRTQTDVLREFLRSLPTMLPEGWHESEFDGRIEGSHEDRRVALYPERNGWVIRFSGDSSYYTIAAETAIEAVEEAKRMIDNWID